MLPRSRNSKPLNLRHLQQQLLFLRQPMFWGATAFLLLTGFFLLEYWQPKAAFHSSKAPAPHDNLLRDRMSANGANRFTGGGLPDLPQPQLPIGATAPLPIDPALPLDAQSAQDKAQARNLSGQSSSFSPGTEGRLARERSRDLYNPTGILIPDSWQRRSSLAQPTEQPATQPSAQPLPESASGTGVSPLQSALDRVEGSGNVGNSPGYPQSSSGMPQNSELPRSAGQVETTGQMGTGSPISTQPIPSYSQPASSQSASSRTTGYTTPPAFRTPQNTAPFYGSSPYSSLNSSSSPNPGQPDTGTLPSTSQMFSPSRVPQPNSGQTNSRQTTPSSSASGGISGGEMNTFSNP